MYLLAQLVSFFKHKSNKHVTSKKQGPDICMQIQKVKEEVVPKINNLVEVQSPQESISVQ